MSYSKILILNNKKIIYYRKKNLTLISIFESNNIFIHSQCRQGYCGSCRIQLIYGKIFYKTKLLASSKEGDIFPCCCIANGNISIKI